MKKAIFIAVAVPFLLLSGAYIFQYGFGLFPCEMCWWQRYPHFAALVFGIAAFAIQKYQKIFTILAAIALAISGLIGAFHAGVEYGWWKGITPCAITMDKGGDFMEALLDAPLVRCDVVAWDLFGISLAGYNFIFSMAASVLIIILTLRHNKR